MNLYSFTVPNSMSLWMSLLWVWMSFPFFFFFHFIWGGEIGFWIESVVIDLLKQFPVLMFFYVCLGHSQLGTCNVQAKYLQFEDVLKSRLFPPFDL